MPYHIIWSKLYKLLVYMCFEAFIFPWKKNLLNILPPFFYIVVYHEWNYINYYSFLSFNFFFFIKYISSWCLEPLLLFVFTDGWLLEIREGFLKKKNLSFIFYSPFLLYFSFLSFTKLSMYVLTKTNVLHLFCLIEVNKLRPRISWLHAKNIIPCTANCLVGLVGVVFVFLLKHYCGT